MGVVRMMRRLIAPPTRVAFTESKVVAQVTDEGTRIFALAGWRDGGGRAFQPSDAWDAVSGGGRNRRLSASHGVSATAERARLDRWDGCAREGAAPAPLAATCAVDLKGVMPDLYARDRIRGESVGLRAIWLTPAPDRCDACGEPFTLAVVRGVDADYVAWSCERRGESVGRQALLDAFASRYGVAVEFD